MLLSDLPLIVINSEKSHRFLYPLYLNRPGQSHILSGATGKGLEPHSVSPVPDVAVTVDGLVSTQAGLSFLSQL